MFKKYIFPKDLQILIVLAIVFVLARVAIFHKTHYLYLLWNLFLAIMPFIISSLLLWYSSIEKRISLILYIGGLIWLLIFPNAPYIVTDLIHIGRGYMANMLYDTMMLFTVAWAGLLLAFYSLFQIETILSIKQKKKTVIIIRILIILLSGFGIYLGRFVRFNSWDVVSQPIQLFSHIWDLLTNPITYTQEYLLTLAFSIFIYVTYIVWREGRVS